MASQDLIKLPQGAANGTITDQASLDTALTNPVLNSATLGNSPSINYQTNPITPAQDITKMDANVPTGAATLGKEATTVQDLVNQITGLNNQLVGEAGYTTEQQQTQNLPELLKQQTDYQNQIKLLKAEQEGLQNQYNYTIPNKMQESAQGRGMTAGGLAPLTASELRKNQIAQGDVATRALTANAFLQASSNNIDTANMLIEKAVKAKYDPIKEQIDVKTKNLNLILKSPAYSLEEKNQAQAQLDIQEAKKAAIEKQAKEEADNKAGVLSVYTDAVKAGASAEVLSGIKNATTQTEALQVAGQFGVYQMEEQKQMAINGYQKITGPSQLKGLTEADILRMPNGDIYKKPVEKINTATQTRYINDEAHTILYDTQTGNTIKDLGVSAITPDKFIQATDAQGNPISFNPATGEYSGGTSSQITSPSGNTYDWSTYNRPGGQEYINSVQQSIDSIGKLNNEAELSGYLSAKMPNSNITAQDVMAVSAKTGVGWEELLGLIQKESPGGASNVAVKNNNFGGITWSQSYQDSHPGVTKGSARPASEGGNYVKFATVKEGLMAQAGQFTKRKIDNKGSNNPAEIAQTIFSGTGSLSGVSTKNNLRANVAMELEKLKQQAKANGDITGMMRASAGGQNMSDTSVSSLEKAVNVVGQLEELQKSVDKEATGPIWGTVRSNNPYDTKAQTIKAQLTAIVPNLARGIYGEVGVLTDNDVALYAKTLPNLQSTQEVSRMVLSATIRSVQRSIENKMAIEAGSGRDVSGLVDMYLKVKAKADAIEAEVMAGVNKEQVQEGSTKWVSDSGNSYDLPY
jgi:hypothetical protein